MHILQLSYHTHSLGDSREKECLGGSNPKDHVKRLFLVDLPEDFYVFWDFCKTLKPNSPSCNVHLSRRVHLLKLSQPQLL